jgi:hypothetical protein
MFEKGDFASERMIPGLVEAMRARGRPGRLHRPDKRKSCLLEPQR